MQNQEEDNFDDVPTSEHPTFFMVFMLFVSAIICPIMVLTAHSHIVKNESVNDVRIQSALFFAIASGCILMYCVRNLLSHAIECRQYTSAAIMSTLTLLIAGVSLAYGLHTV